MFVRRRWCMSCLWSTASVFLHRLVMAPLPPIAAAKQTTKPRQAGTDHLHPEPKVECVVLHTPESPTLDVIFVHGLYGSLGNTWRQGDWRSKYKLDPTKVPLRNHTSNACNCKRNQEEAYNNIHFTYETNLNETEINETDSFKQFNGCLKKILPHENSLITENFYNNTLLNLNKCDVGCGCVCDDCYSSCWPRDWIKEDFPGARVISINYTSDPYLWRPLWVKGSKRLRLHERAEQMIEQLLYLGVGKRPIIWVGHSKGGLFIKQIYCQAYEAYIKTNKNINEKIREEDVGCGVSDREFDDQEFINISVHNGDETDDLDTSDDRNDTVTLTVSSDNKEDMHALETRSSLWQRSAGFMFYSVPHRGSPLAAIKTPITSRSVELLEISKDCQLVLELQDRWLVATRSSRPVVRSLVETCRTLMSVLWLRIVSVDSADAGVGSLHGVSVDHREICKPSSRSCLLYTELTDTIHDAINQCRCRTTPS
ncbi:unnamed protein product [Arctia plantaginis]|uniref:Protein SERAC1 n=1 Tax=Arctia plantaginis TaxID=874455 RepID=A0A8S0ZFZ3_ARCPL|nr:unnamed protein product [Arctia plantaginis]